MSSPLTTRGVTHLYYTSNATGAILQPTLQVTTLRLDKAELGKPTRYRLLLSDGSRFIQSVLEQGLHHLVDSGAVQKGSVIKLTNYRIVLVQEKKLVIISDLSTTDGPIPAVYGTPKNIESNEDLPRRPFERPAPSASTSAFHRAPAPLALEPIASGSINQDQPGPSSRVVMVTQRDLAQVANERAGVPGQANGGPENAVALAAGTGPQRTGSTSRGGFAAGRGGRGGAPGVARGRAKAPAKFVTIDYLSPYASGRWSIRVRVTDKSDIKEWSNANGSGKLFSVTLMDATGEIRAAGFNDAVDIFYDLIDEGKAYDLIGGRVGPVKGNRNFNTVANDFEITFQKDTEIVLVEDDKDVPQVPHKYVTLEALGKMEKDTTCDVLVVLTEIGDLASIIGKLSGKEVSKRDLTVVDQSGYSCRLTVWGKTAEAFAVRTDSIVAFKGVKVGDFKGKTLSMVTSSKMRVNPDIEQSGPLRAWYDQHGQTASFLTHDTGAPFLGDSVERLTVDEVEARGLGTHDKPDYFNLKATISFVKTDRLSYPAHGVGKCMKRVLPDGGTWQCGTCGVEVDEPQHRYLLNLAAEDYTTRIWLTAFDEVGRILLGLSAGEVEEMLADDPAALKDLIVSRCHGQTYLFRCAAKTSTFQDHELVDCSIQSVGKMDWVAESKKLVDLIGRFEGTGFEGLTV